MKKVKVNPGEIKSLLTKVEQKLVKTVHEKPSKEALDRLAIFAGFQDWESFRKELHETPDESPLEMTSTSKENTEQEKK